MRILIMLLVCVIGIGSAIAVVKQSTPTIKKQPLDPHKLSKNEDGKLKNKKLDEINPSSEPFSSQDPGTPATVAS